MSYNKKRGIYTVDCSNLNAIIQDDTPRISAKQADEKKRLEAKRLAELRRKISAISQNSMKSAYPKLSVFNSGHIPKTTSMNGSAVERWHCSMQEEGTTASSLTTSTLCDKSQYTNSETDCGGSLPTVTVVDNEQSSSTTSSPSKAQAEQSIWVKSRSTKPTKDGPCNINDGYESD